jgi:hypothetical protein
MTPSNRRFEIMGRYSGLPENNAVSDFQQRLVAAFRQPTRPFEMAFKGLAGTVGLLFWVYPQDITGHILVILAFTRGVQEGEIGCEMTPVVIRYVIGGWRLISDRECALRFGHE